MLLQEKDNKKERTLLKIRRRYIHANNLRLPIKKSEGGMTGDITPKPRKCDDTPRILKDYAAGIQSR